MLSDLLKTKDNVDHAGHSPQLELLKESKLLPVKEKIFLLNNSLLIAHFSMEILDVTEECPQEHLNMS